MKVLKIPSLTLHTPTKVRGEKLSASGTGWYCFAAFYRYYAEVGEHRLRGRVDTRNDGLVMKETHGEEHAGNRFVY